MRLLKEHWLFFLILSVCAVLRFVPLFEYQFTLDELSGLIRTEFDSFDELIDKGVKIDAHPAFVQVLIYYLSRFFGYANWIIKLPFLLFSLGAIVYAYLFSFKNFSKQAGIFSAIIFSFSLIFVFYSPIARMYISGVFFSVALLYYFFEIFFRKQIKKSNYFFLGLFALLSALNQHINALFAFTLCASGFLFAEKKELKPYIITCVLTVLCYLPHLPVTLYQLNVAGIGFEQGGWLAKPEPNAIFKFLKILFGTGKSYLFFLFAFVLSWMFNKKNILQKNQWFLLMLFLFNYFVVYFYSLYRAPVFQNSVMLFSGSAMVLFAASLLDFKNVYVFYLSVILLSTVLLYKSYFKKDYYNQAVQTVYEQQFERSIHYRKLYSDKQVTSVFFDADDFMKKIYFDRYKTQFDCQISSDTSLSSMKKFSQYVSNLKSDYLILASAMPAQQALVKSYFPYLIENTQTQVINLKVYSKRKEDEKRGVEDDKILKVSTIFSPENFNYPKTQKLEWRQNSVSLKIDSLEEFPFDAIAKYSDVVAMEGQVLLMRTKMKLRRLQNNMLATCIVVRDAESDTTYTYTSKEASDYVVSSDSIVTIFADNYFGTFHNAIKDKSTINCYLWNRGKENAEMKDFEIKLIDYWPQKWHFWD